MSTRVKTTINSDRYGRHEITLERFTVPYNERVSGLVIGDLSITDLINVRNAIIDYLADLVKKP